MPLVYKQFLLSWLGSSASGVIPCKGVEVEPESKDYSQGREDSCSLLAIHTTEHTVTDNEYLSDPSSRLGTQAAKGNIRYSIRPRRSPSPSPGRE